MKRLVDEIRDVLPELLAADPHGPGVSQIVARLKASPADVRSAFDQVRQEPSLGMVVVRYSGRRLHLRLKGVGFAARDRVCPHCCVLFEVRDGGAKQRFCSRSCGLKAAWQSPATRATLMRGAAKKSALAQTPQARAKMREALRTPEARKQRSEQSKKNWRDPAIRQHMIAALSASGRRPEIIEARRQKMKEIWDDPEKREQLIANARRTKSTPESRARQSARSKELWADPEKRAQMTANLTDSHRRRASQTSEIAKARWADPATRERMVAGAKKSGEKRRGMKHGPRSEEYRRAQSDRAKAAWANPETRQKLLPNIAKAQAALRGRKHTDEFKERRRALWRDQDYRAKMEPVLKALSARNLGSKRSPEAIAKWKATMQRRAAAQEQSK